MRRAVKESEKLGSETHLEASKTSGGGHGRQSIPKSATYRHPVKEDRKTRGHLSGDIKERLQVKPEVGERKKPAGKEWVPFKSVDRMGTVASDDAPTGRFMLSLNRHNQTPSMDNDQKIQHDAVQNRLAHKGFTHHEGVLKERGTDDSNEYLYETVLDKQTGDVGLLYRNNHCDRI